MQVFKSICTRAHTHARARTASDGYAPTPKGQGEGSRTGRRLPGPAEVSGRRGRPSPLPPPQGPKAPWGRLLQTSSLAGLESTRPARGRSAGGPRGRSPLPGRPGAPREQRPGAHGSPRDPGWAGAGWGGGTAGRSAPPAGLRGLGPGPGASAPCPVVSGHPLWTPPGEVSPGGVSARVRSGAPRHLWEHCRPDASLPRRPAGRSWGWGGPRRRRDSRSARHPGLPAPSQPPPPSHPAEEGFVPGGAS